MIRRRSSTAMSPPTTSARRTCCAPSPLCCATVRACSSSRAGPAACAPWRLHCTATSRRSIHSTTSTVRSAPGGTPCAMAGLQVRHGRAGSTFPPRSARSRRSAFSPASVAPTICAAASSVAAISPGLIDTGASRRWLDMSGAPPPEEVAGPLLDLALARFLRQFVLWRARSPWPWGATTVPLDRSMEVALIEEVPLPQSPAWACC